jgi:hypothetical protein
MPVIINNIGKWVWIGIGFVLLEGIVLLILKTGARLLLLPGNIPIHPKII